MTELQPSRIERARHYSRSIHYAKHAARDALISRGVIRPECTAEDAWRIARRIEGHRKTVRKRTPGITEAALADSIEAILRRTRARWLPMRELRARLPEHVELSRGDRMASVTRPGEPLWHQKVRNLVSHARSYRGRFVFERGGVGLA